MSDDQIFREVDEDVKRERWLALWNQYGRFVTGLIIVVIAATGGIVLWQNYREGKQIDLSERFTAAIELAADERSTEALAALDGIADAGGGYGMLAQFRQAVLLTEAGDSDAAIEIYRAISETNDFDDSYRDMSVLLMAMTWLSADAPAANSGEIRERLAALVDDSNPFRYTSQELDAAIALAEGDLAGATSRFTALVDDPETPLGLRQRAAELLQAIEGS